MVGIWRHELSLMKLGLIVLLFSMVLWAGLPVSQSFGLGLRVHDATSKRSGLYVGKSYGGGKIAYVDETGLHGFIVATTNQSNGAIWSVAVSLCNNLVLNSYDDWYLPSLSQLYTLYNNRALIGADFTFYYYWSSTEGNATIPNAWVLYLEGPVAYTASPEKENPICSYCVRAVRNF